MSLQKKVLKNQLFGVSYAVLKEEAERMGKEAAKREMKNTANQIGNAIQIALREVFKAGYGRTKKFTDIMNKYLPDWLGFEPDPEVFKRKSTLLHKEQFYDLAEILIAVNCNRSCNKNPEKCQLRKMMKEKNIPAWDENGKCEYKIELKKIG